MTDAHAWRGWAALAVLATGLQLYGLYRVSGPPSTPWFPHADKVQHAAGFALPVGLVLLTLAARSGQPPSRRTVAAVTGAFGAHAVLSEVIQHRFYLTRSGDPLDVVADGVGIALGAGTALRLLGGEHRGAGTQ